MKNIEQYKDLAKTTIKERFNAEIEIDIVPFVHFDIKKQELAAKYSVKINNEIKRGVFVPFNQKNSSHILIGYEDEYDLNTIFFHELQHAIDYHEFYELHGKEGFDSIGFNFTLATEFRACYFERLNEFLIIPVGELDRYIIGVKMHFKGKLNQFEKILDVFNYLAIISAIAKEEGYIDRSMLQRSPGADYYIDLIKHLLKYEPTFNWFDVLDQKVQNIND